MALYLWDYGGHRVPHLARRTYGSSPPCAAAGPARISTHPQAPHNGARTCRDHELVATIAEGLHPGRACT
jgi:hypothetical protein